MGCCWTNCRTEKGTSFRACVIGGRPFFRRSAVRGPHTDSSVLNELSLHNRSATLGSSHSAVETSFAPAQGSPSRTAARRRVIAERGWERDARAGIGTTKDRKEAGSHRRLLRKTIHGRRLQLPSDLTVLRAGECRHQPSSGKIDPEWVRASRVSRGMTSGTLHVVKSSLPSMRNETHP